MKLKNLAVISFLAGFFILPVQAADQNLNQNSLDPSMSGQDQSKTASVTTAESGTDTSYEVKSKIKYLKKKKSAAKVDDKTNSQVDPQINSDDKVNVNLKNKSNAKFKILKDEPVIRKVEYIKTLKTSDVELRKLIDAALSVSPDIQEKSFNKEESENLVKQSYSSVLPVVTANAGTGNEYTDSPGNESKKLDTQELSLGVHQNIFGEGHVADIKINKSVVDSKIQELEQIKNLITLATIESYLNIVRYSTIAKIQKDSIESHNDTLERTRVRLDAGLMRASDLLLTEARTASAKSNLAATNSQLERARNLLYRYSNIDVRDHELTDVDLPQNLPKDFTTAWDEVLKENPIIKAKYHEIKTSDYITQKEKLALYPSVSLDLLARKTFDSDGIVGAQEDLSAMVNVKYQFSFGTEFYKTAVAGSRLRLKRAEYQKSKSDIYQNLGSLYSDYKEISDRIEFLKSNRDNLEDVVEKHKKEFEAGFRSLFDLLNTKNEFFNADIQYINAVYDRKILAYTILANTGNLLKYFDK